jgi:hypothetical protein
MQGAAEAVDGNFLHLGAYSIRLQGVAAPELHEAGGPEDAEFMAQLTAG